MNNTEHGLSILLVDDDPALLTSLSAALRLREPEVTVDRAERVARLKSSLIREILAAAQEWFQVPMKPTGKTLRAEVQGSMAYVVQEYSNEVHLPNGPTLTVTGKSLGVFRRENDGTWKIEALVVNRDPESK